MGDDNEAVELYRKHRPRKLADVVGQDQAVAVLRSYLESQTLPNVLLFSGPSGTGNYTEFNAAISRGIDTIREIEVGANVYPLGNDPCRMWVLDECFHRDSLVSVPGGTKRIGDIREGDVVRSLSGWSTVRRVFRNRVPFARVAKLIFDNGTEVFCSREHRFLTADGWKAASDLDFQDRLFVVPGYDMGHGNPENLSNLSQMVFGIGSESEDLFPSMRLEIEKGFVRPVVEKAEDGAVVSNLHRMQFRIPVQSVSGKQTTEMLFSKMRICDGESSKGIGTYRGPFVSVLRNRIHDQEVSSESLLWQIVSGERQNDQTRNEEEFVLSGIEASVEGELQKVHGITCREIGKTEEVIAFVGQTDAGMDRSEDQTDQGAERDLTRLAGRKRGQRENIECSKETASTFGRPSVRMGLGVGDQNWGETIWLPQQLQGRSRFREDQTGSGSRWEWPSVEVGYVKGCKENPLSQEARLVCFEGFKPGCNDEQFAGVVKDSPGNGTVEFFDLEIDGHPSYFVNGFPVHNCHAWTRDAQNAVLKVLEDCPQRARFVICTTEPNKLLPTILGRCEKIKVKPIDPKSMEKLVRRTLEAEKKKLSDEVIDKVVEVADGCGREALVLLGKVLQLPDESDQVEVLGEKDAKRQAMDLVRALQNPRSKWSQIAEIIESVDEEPERLRRMVLTCASNGILKGWKNSHRLYLVLTAFEGSFFESGRSGLVRACWEVAHAG